MDITSIQPPTAAPSPQLDLSVQNTAVQQQLNRLPVGVTLVGVVAGNDKNGNVIIKLAGNDLILSSPTALSKDAQIALKVDNVSGSFVATLLSVDGKLPATQPQAVSNQLQQNPNNLFKTFENPNALKIISVLNQGAAKLAPVQTATPQAIVPKADIVSLTSPKDLNVKALLITATPEIVQGLRSSIVLNSTKQSTSSELLESLPEEITPGTQLNLKISNLQNPPKTAPNIENQIIQTDNRILAKPEEEEQQVTVKQAITTPATTTNNISNSNNTPLPTSQPQAPAQPQILAQVQGQAETETPATTTTIPAQNQADIPKPQTELQITQTSAAPEKPAILNQPALQAAEPNTPAKQIANNLQQLVQNFAASFKPLPNGNILLNAIVIDTKPGGELLVETRFGKMIIDAGEQFSLTQKGAVIDLELTSIASSPKPTLKLPEEELPLQQLAKTWPALKELSEHMAPQLGPTTMVNKLAGVDNVFAGRLAAFMNALKTGDVRDWLGANNYDALEDDDTGSQILGKVKHDIGVMRDLMAERSTGGWQTMLFPIFDGRDLHQARLHVKYLPDQDNHADKKIGTRFIVELDTSHFGEIQMDGLVHNNVNSKYFDMIIRTHQAFDAEMETDIRQIFTDAGQITGFRGDIEFATMREFPLKIMDQIINKKLNQQIDHKGIEA